MTVRFIGAALSAGGPHRGCRHGPAAFQLGQRRLKPHLQSVWQTIIRESQFTPDAQPPIVTSVIRRLNYAVRQTMMQRHFPIVIGGDHSCAIGTWSGVARSVKGGLGLLWIDAHMDFHTPASSPSGNLHGMPLATLCGAHTVPSLGLMLRRRVINPKQCVVLGCRSFEASEPSLLTELGVTCFTAQDIAREGLAALVQRALNIVRQGTMGYGISIDLDAFDPKDAPGITVAEPDGLNAAEFFSVFRTLPFNSGLRALEVAEYNPSFDRGRITQKLMSELVEVIALNKFYT